MNTGEEIDLIEKDLKLKLQELGSLAYQAVFTDRDIQEIKRDKSRIKRQTLSHVHRFVELEKGGLKQ